MLYDFMRFVFPTNVVGTRTKIAFGSAILEIVAAIATSIFKFGIAGAIVCLVFAAISFMFARTI